MLFLLFLNAYNNQFFLAYSAGYFLWYVRSVWFSAIFSLIVAAVSTIQVPEHLISSCESEYLDGFDSQTSPLTVKCYMGLWNCLVHSLCPVWLYEWQRWSENK